MRRSPGSLQPGRSWKQNRALALAAPLVCLSLASPTLQAQSLPEYSLRAAETTGSIVSPAASRPNALPVVRSGDKLQLAFYERLDSDEDKWRANPGKAQLVPRGFHQRAELTGEYAVQESGRLSLPLLGEFDAVGRGVDEVRQEITLAFERLIDRRGFVNVLGIVHQPIQIIGAVKNPGSFPFKRGMTPAHALALAGGLVKKDMEPWQRVEAGREFERLQRALDKVKRLVARDTVLKSERDGETGVTPGLVNALGPRDARILVAEEDWQRNLSTASRTAQETALSVAAQNARRDLAIRSEKAGVIDNGYKLRRERAESLTQLYDKKLVSKPVMAQIQSEFADASDRRLQSIIDIEAARQRVAASERDIQSHKLETGIEVSRAISINTRETVDAVADGEGMIQVMLTLTAGQGAPVGEPTFEIIRNGPNGVVVLQAHDIASLEPGDLVRVK